MAIFTVRWSNVMGTSYWDKVHVWRGTRFSLNEDTGGQVIATVSVYSGSMFIGTYQDTAGDINSFYSVRFYASSDGAFTPWSPKTLARQFGNWYHSIRDLYDFYDDLDGLLSITQGTNDIGSQYFPLARHSNRVFNIINNRAREAYPIPISAGDDGSYDPNVVDISCRLTIGRLLKRSLMGQAIDTEEFDYWDKEAQQKLCDLVNGKELLSGIPSLFEAGVGVPIASPDNHGGSKIQIDRTVLYTGEKIKTITVQIDTTGNIDTLTASGGSATFKYSYDGGRSWFRTALSCGSESYPASLGDGVTIWWIPSGDSAIFDCVAGDKWTIRCVPFSQAARGRGLKVGRMILG